MKLKLTCKEAGRWISEGLDRKLSLEAERHVAVCPICTRKIGKRVIRRAAVK